MGKLNNKTALITGGSSGIGLAAAQLLAEEGASVFITGRRQSELDKAVALIGGQATALQGDAASLEDLDRVFATVKEQAGQLDILVINAGIAEMKTLPEVTPEHFDQIFNVNVRGAFFSAQKALPLMPDGSAIVLVSSAAHSMGVPVYTVYSATKAAMRSFTRTWAAELKGRRIRVNSLSPGPIDTPIFDKQAGASADDLKAAFAQQVPLGRVGDAVEMARAILFLASDDSSYSTGIDLVADGGISQF